MKDRLLKMVITDDPCSGKTTAIKRIRLYM